MNGHLLIGSHVTDLRIMWPVDCGLGLDGFESNFMGLRAISTSGSHNLREMPC